ncbi:uncharacterized protein LOC133818102 [Humulus lupulus]|uniref:uncharacterized protein LOC133818102 n=1 Tax=Humulus lupulus TaxID=3486 RepID=UPI002B4021C8|nr:uncharacterized protein LOC133818102 [Humulus lupulus]
MGEESNAFYILRKGDTIGICRSLSDCQAQVGSSDSCILEFDGALKGNPGLVGAGAVLRAEDGSAVWQLREGVGIATNNVAEYRALLLGLKQALKKGFKHIRCQGDSMLVCMQRFRASGKSKTRIWLTCVNRQRNSWKSFCRFRSIMFSGCVDIDLFLLKLSTILVLISKLASFDMQHFL